MKSFEKIYKINAPVGKVWDALVNPHTITQWGGGVCTMSIETGAEFKLWNGDIYGTNTKVIAEQELRQDWYGGDWDKPSHVVFKLSEKDGKTEVQLTQTHIPDDEFNDIKDGWDRYYMEPLTSLVEK